MLHAKMLLVSTLRQIMGAGSVKGNRVAIEYLHMPGNQGNRLPVQTRVQLALQQRRCLTAMSKLEESATKLSKSRNAEIRMLCRYTLLFQREVLNSSQAEVNTGLGETTSRFRGKGTQANLRLFKILITI